MMINRQKAIDLVASAPHFSKEILRALKFSYGDVADSSVKQLKAEIDDYDVVDVSLRCGDLTVNGLLEDAINDHSLLIVLGDLAATMLFSQARYSLLAT